jgi:filamentous hemagglutinin family protein
MPRLLPLIALLLAGPLCLEANPTGGAVAAGSATIAGQGSPAVTINQASNTAIINWQTFSIGSGELTKFIQPSSSSATLNRVLGGQTSFINGTLSANGQIYLINGNGIIVGSGGVINTAGFTGSTRDISDSDFLSGNLHFIGGSDAGVQNLGTISALGGNVVLIGKTVDNAGAINATGTAALAAGDDVLLAQANPDGSTVTVNPVSAPSAASTKIGVKNTGTIKASAAELKAANGNIYALAIQNDGLIQATTVTQQGGHIYLTADSGTIVNSGTLDASATAAKGVGGTVLLKSKAGKVVHSGKIIAKGGQGGAGGNAEISGAQIAITGSADLTAPGGATGDLLLDPSTLEVITGGGTNPNASTVDPTTVDSLLTSADLTLTADTNITITNAISWDSSSTLTLATNNTGSTININAGITDSYSGAGGLTIHMGQAADVISTSLNGTINVANFNLEQGAWVQLVEDGSNSSSSIRGNIPATVVNNVTTYVLPAFTASNDFEVSLTGATFLRANGGNGNDVYYGLVDIYGVQGMQGFLSSNFTLNGNYVDASSTANWNGGKGFAPIGSENEPYQGSFSNGGVENLTINRPNQDEVGLISVTGANADINGIAVYYSTITGGDDTGALVGDNYGTIQGGGAYGTTVTGGTYVGGVAGYNEENALVENLQGDIQMSVNGNSDVGGLVGVNDGLMEGDLYLGNVSALSVDGSNFCIGGLAGYNYTTGTISQSYFGGGVIPGSSEAYYVGGIAGENDGTITASYTTPGSSVAGDNTVGGIAGYNIGLIQDSYNSGSVTGRANYSEGDGGQNIGGIAGENTQGSSGNFVESIDTASSPNPGMVQTSYNTGRVDGVGAVGGIAGYNDSTGTVNTCYNVGSIGDSNASYVGGIVGDNYGYVTNTYDSGLVSGNSDSGTVAGIIGFDEDNADTENSYLDTDTSGQTLFTNSNNGNEGDTGTPAFENNFAAVTSSGGAPTAYTQAGNSAGDGTGYSFFGSSSAVSNTNGVYQIGTSPDSGGGPAWYIIEGQTRPMLAMEATETIANPHELQLMAVNLSGFYYAAFAFDASPTNGVNNPAEVWSTAGFDPIGTAPEGVAFDGALYGNYDTITGLYINRPTTNYVGLFGYTGPDTTIDYVILNDSMITGNNIVGGIVGANHGTLTYDQNDNDGSGAIIGQGVKVGGLVGDNFGQITYSQNYSYNTEGPTVTGSGSDIGGIAGYNESSATIGEDTNNANIAGKLAVNNVGGIAGFNAGTVTQSINTGNVGSGTESNVGGLVGDNLGQVDDSYSGGGNQSGLIDGDANVGGLVGNNGPAAILETSYNTSTVEGTDSATTGAVAGANSNIVQHVYWEADVNSEQPGIGSNADAEGTMGVRSFTASQLADANNFAQGSAPQLWDFSPQTGDGGGVWGVNVYTDEGTGEGGQPINGLVNNGLPVLQWQYPINAKVTATGGDQPYGYTPSYTVTGQGASQFSTFVPNPTITVTGGSDAGDTQQVAVSGTPNNYGFNVEYVNGTVNVVPDDIFIIPDSFTVASGSPTPTLTATISGFQPGHDPSDPQLSGELELLVSPSPATSVGLHSITASGITSPSGDYEITYIPGVLNVTASTPTPTQQLLTFETELGNIQNAFDNDPTNGLDPLAFIIFPNQVGLGGDEDGAINDKKHDRDYAYAVGTHNLPSFSRLVTPGTGVVAIVDGVVIIGDPATGKPVFLNQGGGFSQQVLTDLSGVLSPSVYSALLALIHGP